MLLREWIDVLILSVISLWRLLHTAIDVKLYDDATASIEWHLSTSALVLRGNELCEIKIADIVPGDVVHLSQV